MICGTNEALIPSIYQDKRRNRSEFMVHKALFPKPKSKNK